MEDALPYQDKAFLYLEYCADQEVCSHFLPEEAAAWEGATCSKCETNWSTKLQEVLVQPWMVTPCRIPASEWTGTRPASSRK